MIIPTSNVTFLVFRVTNKGHCASKMLTYVTHCAPFDKSTKIWKYLLFMPRWFSISVRVGLTSWPCWTWNLTLDVRSRSACIHRCDNLCAWRNHTEHRMLSSKILSCSTAPTSRRRDYVNKETTVPDTRSCRWCMTRHNDCRSFWRSARRWTRRLEWPHWCHEPLPPPGPRCLPQDACVLSPCVWTPWPTHSSGVQLCNLNLSPNAWPFLCATSYLK